MQTKRVLAGVLTSTLLLGACPAALAADYNDSSLTGRFRSLAGLDRGLGCAGS